MVIPLKKSRLSRRFLLGAARLAVCSESNVFISWMVASLGLQQRDLVFCQADTALFIQFAQCPFIIFLADTKLFVDCLGRAVVGQGGSAPVGSKKGHDAIA